MKHTDGQWHYEFSKLSNISVNGQFTVKAGVAGRPICILPMPLGGINPKEKQEANAKLISAAPELLTMLDDCASLLEKIGNRVDIPEDLMEWYGNTLMNSQTILNECKQKQRDEPKQV